MPTAVLVSGGKPSSESYRITHRIASRFEPSVVTAFVTGIDLLKGSIDEDELAAAVAGGNESVIEQAAGAGRLGAILLGGGALEDALLGASTASGEAAAGVVSDTADVEVTFNARHPNVVIAAREQTANLVVQVGDDVKEAIRVVTALGADQGLTTTQQAKAVREVVGLPPNWASAPLKLGEEIRSGNAAAATSRRLSAADKAKIRARIKAGTVTEDFVAEMQAKYTQSLINRRAKNIARTETLRAAHAGQRESWKQAVDQGALPATARRMWIVTPDDRLRDTHAAIPGMNSDGVGLDDAFDTPFGRIMDPPAEANCRCSVGLIFPGRAGVL